MQIAFGGLTGQLVLDRIAQICRKSQLDLWADDRMLVGDVAQGQIPLVIDSPFSNALSSSDIDQRKTLVPKKVGFESLSSQCKGRSLHATVSIDTGRRCIHQRRVAETGTKSQAEALQDTLVMPVGGGQVGRPGRRAVGRYAQQILLGHIGDLDKANLIPAYTAR